MKSFAITISKVVFILGIILAFTAGCNLIKPTEKPRVSDRKTIKFVYSELGDTSSISVKKTGDNLYYEGDILVYELEDSLLNRIAIDTLKKDSSVVYSVGVQRRFRWTNGIIPFKIQANHPFESLIRVAISEMESLTNVCFKEKTSGRYVSIEYDPNGGCYSTIGDPTYTFLDIEFDAKINLGPGCGSKGIILHELGHTVGLFHEHSRSDRDNYVRIKWQNIKSGEQDNFNKRHWYWGKDIHSYDCSSIMHYSPREFSKNGNNTIDNVNCQVPFGQRDSLSPGDIRGINSMYYWVTGCPVALNESIDTTVWHIEAAHSGKLLSLEKVSKDNRVGFVQDKERTYLPAAAASQKFKIVPAEGNYYFIKNLHSNKFLTIEGSLAGNYCGYKPPAPIPSKVVQRDKYSSSCYRESQKWKFIPLGNSTYKIVSKIEFLYASWALEIKDASKQDNGEVITGKPANKQHQKFILKNAPKQPFCGATFIRQTVPDTLDSTGDVPVSLTFKNTGNTSWFPGHKLDPIFKGFNTIPVQVQKEILPGEEVTFNFSIGFPSPGVYKFQWRMYRFDPFCHGHFGYPSELIEIHVGRNAECEDILNNIEVKESLKNSLQLMLQNASPGQKAGIIRSIDQVGGELVALKDLAKEKGCI